MAQSEEPGAARYGNFINYYDFNPADRRISLLPTDLLPSITREDQVDIVALDVGCNSGVLTMALYDYMHRHGGGREIYILAVDLDKGLIQRCKEHCPYSNISFHVADILECDDSESPIQTFLNKHKRTKFDLVTCFSVTLWIHINHGDETFQNFLRIMSNLSRYLILEPQPWKCYKSAVRRMKKLGCNEFQHFKSLKWTHTIVDDMIDYLKFKCGMKLISMFGETEWERQIFLLHKTDSEKISNGYL